MTRLGLIGVIIVVMIVTAICIMEPFFIFFFALWATFSLSMIYGHVLVNLIKETAFWKWLKEPIGTKKRTGNDHH